MSKKIDKLRDLMDASPTTITAKREPVAEPRSFNDADQKLFSVDASGCRISLVDWSLERREFLESAFRRHRAILFRGFQLDENGFPEVVSQCSSQVLDY